MAHQSSFIESDIAAYLKSNERTSLLRFITCGGNRIEALMISPQHLNQTL